MALRAFDRPLSAAAMTQVMTDLMTGRLSEDETRTFLTDLARRGETAEELAAAVQVLRTHAVALPLSTSDPLGDTCGTGGDRQGTFNISTLAALIAAAAGVRIAKHGNRAASSRCGSADLLEALGINLQASPQQVARCIEEAGFGFCFAPVFHPAMKAVAPVRRALGIRTIFNLIGPLANPAPLTFQLVGVSEAPLLQPMAEALVRLGVRRGLVVHGADGLDEVTTTGPTQALEVRAGAVTERRIDPVELGVARAALESLRGGDAAHNARLTRELFEGRRPALRDIVTLNAGCVLYLAGRAPSIAEGISLASRALTSGAVGTLLTRVKELSHAG